MRASLKALLTGAIDYAGMFPPAKLPLEQAFRNYLRYRQEPEAWMLGRFVVPAARLSELRDFRGPLTPMQPIGIAVLGRGGETRKQFVDNLALDLQDVACLQSFDGLIQASVLEARLPLGLEDGHDLFDLLVASITRIEESTPSISSVYLELPPPLAWLESMRLAVGLIAEARRLRSLLAPPVQTIGFKLRCGGAGLMPSSLLVARALRECHAAGVPLKLTAGLHHPLPRNITEEATMHGFINVLVASVLLHAGTLKEDQIVDVLVDREPSAFLFDDVSLSWRGCRVDLVGIEAGRRGGVVSFGSCSFDEPRDDLRVLGWL